jgi:NAD(P)H-hydrate epimerase
LQWKTLEKFESILKISVITKADLKRAKEMITNADGIIDAIFGTGYLGKIIKEPQRSAIELINSSKAYIISNDVPSGTNADTGEVLDISVLPDTIVVLHRMKPGITMKKGRGFVVESIGIPSDVEKEIS